MSHIHYAVLTNDDSPANCAECGEMFTHDSTAWADNEPVVTSFASLNAATREAYGNGFRAGRKALMAHQSANFDLFKLMLDQDFVWVEERDCDCGMMSCRRRGHDTIVVVHMTDVNAEERVVEYWNADEVRAYINRT